MTMVREKCSFIFSKVSSKGLTELKANFGRFLDETLAQSRKPRKSRSANEIIALMCVKSM